MNKYDNAMMETARVWAKQSHCIRNKVGAIISKDGRIVSNGYNGTVHGADNCCEEGNEKVVSKNSVVHAEANAILFAVKNGITTNGCKVYITLSPCIECAKMIVQSGITEVLYQTEYRDTTGIEFLKENSIQVRQILV